LLYLEDSCSPDEFEAILSKMQYVSTNNTKNITGFTSVQHTQRIPQKIACALISGACLPTGYTVKHCHAIEHNA